MRKSFFPSKLRQDRSVSALLDGLVMMTFSDLAASRREWIAEVLIPWSRQASYRDLIEAEQDWGNIAGQVDQEMTLWTWAWSRFPAVIHDGMPGLNETCEVLLKTTDGREATGYPDRQASSRGQIVLISRGEDGFEKSGPFRIDEITSIDLSGPATDSRAEPAPRLTTTLPPETPPDVRI